VRGRAVTPNSLSSRAITPDLLPVFVSSERAPGWWGMVLFVATEATIFGCLIASYFYIRAGAPTWPPSGMRLPELSLPIPMTVLLVGSSLPMWWAESGIRHGNRRRLRIGLAVAFVLAAAFLIMQAVEYSRKDYSIATNVYGSLFYLITGLHGMHVLAALITNAVVQLRAWLGHFDERRHLAVQNAAIYWHFVDAAWIVIFLSLYVSPYVLPS
jgi:heme/copper-type cytochrome/quinol oxidase subunit 3